MKRFERDMKANELMIGNIVGYSSLTRMVTAINPPYFIDLGNGERTTITNVCIEHLNPIPITEELLLKNGFTYREDRYCGRDLHIYTKKVYGQFMIECTEGSQVTDSIFLMYTNWREEKNGLTLWAT